MYFVFDFLVDFIFVRRISIGTYIFERGKKMQIGVSRDLHYERINSEQK